MKATNLKISNQKSNPLFGAEAVPSTASAFYLSFINKLK